MRSGFSLNKLHDVLDTMSMATFWIPISQQQQQQQSQSQTLSSPSHDSVHYNHQFLSAIPYDISTRQRQSRIWKSEILNLERRCPFKRDIHIDLRVWIEQIRVSSMASSRRERKNLSRWWKKKNKITFLKCIKKMQLRRNDFLIGFLKKKKLHVEKLVPIHHMF